MSRSPSRRKDHVYAVLTGDIVGSTGLGAAGLAEARRVFFDAVASLRAASPELVVGDAEFFRGDSWQILLSDPQSFLRAALVLRAALRRASRDYDTRIGVGFGQVERIEPERISTSIGDAFTASGTQLDAMSDGIGVTVAVPHGSMGPLGWLVPLCALCSAMVNSWSERQSDIAVRMLATQAPRQSDIATEIDVSKQMISKTLASIDFPAILSAVEWVEGGKWTRHLRPPAVRFV